MVGIVTRCAMESRRMQAIELLRQGVSQAEVARKFDVTESAVSQWKKKWKTQGKKSLRGKPHTGRPAKLEEDQKEQFTTLLDGGALACGFETDDWTCPRVQRLIAERFDVEYHVDHCPVCYAIWATQCSVPNDAAPNTILRPSPRGEERTGSG